MKLDAMEARVEAIGHSHVALFFRREDEHAPGGTAHDVSTGRWLLNPGGVGQPRDGDPRAAWLEVDTEHSTATWQRVELDVERIARPSTAPACRPCSPSASSRGADRRGRYRRRRP